MDDTANPKPLAELIRDRMFRVQPRFWTEKRMGWVGCRFEDVVDNATEYEHVGSDLGYASDQPEDAILKIIQAQQWSKKIVDESLASRKTWYMTKLLMQARPSIYLRRRNNIWFSFAGKNFHRTAMKVYYGLIPPSEANGFSPPPVVGFHVMNHTEARCLTCSGIWYRDHPQTGVLRRLIKGLPEECPARLWPHYPYLGCMLLAMAQNQEKIWGGEFECPAYTTKLMVMNVEDLVHMHIYKAKCSEKLIEALKRPNFAAEVIEWPVIEHSKVAYQPYATFQRRLLGALGVLPEA